ncbi:MAG TPA: phosphoenolpyruvate synthase regulatory protein [Rhodospirillaceae bacterium]|nr:phosphoenolpyruvate synthase regulatory protein [Rhodospirillaceae bacterium]
MEIHHLHLVSDSTGETIKGVTRAALAQFQNVIIKRHHWFLVDSQSEMDRVLKTIKEKPGLVFSTFGDKELMFQLEAGCAQLDVPHVGLMDTALNALSGFLGQPIQSAIGKQHTMDEAYFRRIEAMDFALDHDDGQNPVRLAEADVVLVGVSRTSKTPTSIYLANRGIKAANVPLVPGIDPPAVLLELTKPLIVGLTSEPDHLAMIRRSRLKNLSTHSLENYSDIDRIEEELRNARRMFNQHGWPVVDVTRRSIEETAAEIIGLLDRRLEAEGEDLIEL